jgi:hypothetical protein
MAFNVNEFKAKMNQYGGLARTSLFVVSIFDTSIDRPPSEYIPTKDLRFFCKTATLPGINLNVSEYRPNGFGMPQSIPMGMNNESLNCVFMLDSDHKVLSYFHEWMQKIINYDVSGGVFSSVGDKYPYELGYKKDYVVAMEIRFYSAHNPEESYVCTLKDVFPTQIGSINLSWEDNNSVATLPVNFSYSEIKMQSAATGIVTSQNARGTGYLQFLNSIGTIGQTIKQTSLPTSIQDAINRFTNVGSQLPRMNNFFRL